ncbi:methyltransferase domain-containing protein [Candidatus Kaiserbacteria bacterium]|nr:methyltransferase domain-containing protein [Candidatus Kaiserbacteria bacterium]
MNVQLSQETLRGKVVDIGGGHRPNYFDYFQREADVVIEPLDASMSGIDFEKDELPYADDSVDTVILCNMLEHMYNYRFLLSEIRRIMKPSAQIIGFVPFWVGYHADPHDYFRYTDECLERVFEDAGFKNIRITRVGGSPVIANFNTIMLTFPAFTRPLLFLLYYPFDKLFVRLRPKSVRRNPLGYVFTMRR